MRGGLWIEAAFTIGATLCRDALWHGRRCTWFGPSLERMRGDWRVVPRTYGPDLYGGTAGNALFLAQLYRLSGDPLVRATAEGALRQALSRQEDIEPGVRAGFYTGWSGLAWVAAQVGAALEDQRWTERGVELLARLAEQAPESQGIDVLAGVAGGIVAALGVRSAANAASRGALLELAMRYGEHLLTQAYERGASVSWDTLGGGVQDHLTGLSHGTAGIAWALLELAVASGEQRFEQGARRGFDYERGCYSPHHRNWPDLRDLRPNATAQIPQRPVEPTYPLLWCHGAPGIGLTRVRAFELTGEVEFLAEARAALETTAQDLGGGSPSVDNWSLCHGFAGNAELLIQASAVLGEPVWRQLAEGLALRGIARHGRGDVPWPSGLKDASEAPNLMLGKTGTGYFFLRLASPKVPSVLLPAPSGLSASSAL